MTVTINNQTFNAERMSTPEELSKGMMGRPSIDGCMVFELNRRGYHIFWMKGCLIPLDIVFVNNNKITTIHPNCEPPQNGELPVIRYSGYGDHVIEFPSGTTNGWGKGDHVHFR